MQNLFGNATETDVAKVQEEFQAVLIDQEQVQKAFKLFRDMFVMTQFRLIVIDKQGITGSKQNIVSIPWKSVKKFGCETAGFMDGDGELRIWVAGEGAPMKFEISRKVNIKEVYAYLSYYVITA